MSKATIGEIFRWIGLVSIGTVIALTISVGTSLLSKHVADFIAADWSVINHSDLISLHRTTGWVFGSIYGISITMILAQLYGKSLREGAK